MVPFQDMKGRHVAEREAYLKVIGDVIDSGELAGGRYVEKFERDFATYCGVAHAVGVGSGTEALWLTLLALGIGPLSLDYMTARYLARLSHRRLGACGSVSLSSMGFAQPVHPATYAVASLHAQGCGFCAVLIPCGRAWPCLPSSALAASHRRPRSQPSPAAHARHARRTPASAGGQAINGSGRTLKARTVSNELLSTERRTGSAGAMAGGSFSLAAAAAAFGVAALRGRWSTSGCSRRRCCSAHSFSESFSCFDRTS